MFGIVELSFVEERVTKGWEEERVYDNNYVKNNNSMIHMQKNLGSKSRL